MPLKLSVLAVICVLSFIAGVTTSRKLQSTSAVETIQQQEQEKSHTVTTRVITHTASGDKTVETTDTVSTDSKTQTATKTAPVKKTNVSALASVDTARAFVPVYGVSITRELVGPITIGAFGFTNGVVGLSVGINF